MYAQEPGQRWDQPSVGTLASLQPADTAICESQAPDGTRDRFRVQSLAPMTPPPGSLLLPLPWASKARDLAFITPLIVAVPTSVTSVDLATGERGAQGGCSRGAMTSESSLHRIHTAAGLSLDCSGGRGQTQETGQEAAQRSWQEMAAAVKAVGLQNFKKCFR